MRPGLRYSKLRSTLPPRHNLRCAIYRSSSCSASIRQDQRCVWSTAALDLLRRCLHCRYVFTPSHFDCICQYLDLRVGTIVEATSNGVSSFCGGAVLYELGYVGVILLLEILIADTTTLRNRLVFSYIPALPFIINTWIGGNVVDAVIGTTTWHWGIGTCICSSRGPTLSLTHSLQACGPSSSLSLPLHSFSP